MSSFRKNGNYFTSIELIEKYPKVIDLGWTPVKIGFFLNAGLLLGYYDHFEKRNVIQEQSFQDLIQF